MKTGNNIFQSLFNEQPTSAPEEKANKGRCADLLELRNEELMHRYLYYGLYTDKRNEAIFEQLVVEFYLKHRTVCDLIYANYDKLKEMRKNPPTVKELREMYPHKVW